MKVVHLLSSNSFSGAEKVVVEICNYFSKEFDMIYMSRDGRIKDALDNQRINYNLYTGLHNLYNKLNNEEPDIVHAHDIKSSILASIYHLFHRKVRVISHIHGNSPQMRKLSAKSILYYLSTVSFYKIIWVSNSCFDSYIFKNMLKNKSVVLSNVILINSSKMKKTIDFAYDLIFLGRLEEPKNPIRFINIVAGLKNKFPKIKTVVVGDGSMYQECIDLVSKKMLSKNIEFVGFQKNPFIYLNNSKILVMTSNFEGMPIAALEALSVGNPIVATKTDGLVEIVKDEVNGYLSNDQEDLMSKISKILSDNALYEKLSENALNSFNDYNDSDKYYSTIRIMYKGE